ncbi:MAG: hypothetical protein LIO45_06020 [Clostridiales bacterium]|nr:hypothetical protein [Clostridiales bacterium]
MSMEPTSIIQMARGAVIERIDLEMLRVMENIQDLNTEPGKARQITVKVSFKPDNSRENIKVSYQVQSTLAPAAPIETSLYAGIQNQKLFAVENVPQVPGQIGLNGEEQEPPKLVALG